jgi:hypothetical protein
MKMKLVPWPRYVVSRFLADGRQVYYWTPRKRDLQAGFPIKAQALVLNTLKPSGAATATPACPTIEVSMASSTTGGKDASRVPAHRCSARSSVLFWRYEQTRAFKRVSVRAGKDYRRFLGLIADIPLANGGRLGEAHLAASTPRPLIGSMRRLRRPAKVHSRRRSPAKARHLPPCRLASASRGDVCAKPTSAWTWQEEPGAPCAAFIRRLSPSTIPLRT